MQSAAWLRREEPERIAPDRYFEFLHEHDLAAIMRAGFAGRSYHVWSVARSPAPEQGSPDVIMKSVGGGRREFTADFKTPEANAWQAIQRAIRDGRSKTRRVVINARQRRPRDGQLTIGAIPLGELTEGIAAGVRNYGYPLDEIVVLGIHEGCDFVLRWPW